MNTMARSSYVEGTSRPGSTISLYDNTAMDNGDEEKSVCESKSLSSATSSVDQKKRRMKPYQTDKYYL
jgi:hypothetical protein